MGTNTTAGEPRVATSTRHRWLRYAAAALSAACAAVYFLIGFGIVYGPPADSAMAIGMLVFGLSAGLAYALGAVLLVAFDRRIVWILGGIFQAFAILAYIGVAEDRSPPFEIWGLMLKVAQVAILGLLAALILTTPGQASSKEPAVGGV